MIIIQCDNCRREEGRDRQFDRGWWQVKQSHAAPVNHLCCPKCVAEFAEKTSGVPEETP